MSTIYSRQQVFSSLQLPSYDMPRGSEFNRDLTIYSLRRLALHCCALARTPEMAEQAPAPLHVAILGAGPIGLEQPWTGLPLSADIHLLERAQ